MTSQYKRFINLLSKWPVDHTKQERDLSKHIREKVKLAFSEGAKTDLDSEYCARQYSALSRLADNHHCLLYKRDTVSSATGLSPEECNIILSSEFLNYIKEENQSFFNKVIKKKN